MQNLTRTPELNPPLRLEVGIDDFLHIEWELKHRCYPCDGCITGKVFFIDLKLHINAMSLQIVRKESVGSGAERVLHVKEMREFELVSTLVHTLRVLNITWVSRCSFLILHATLCYVRCLDGWLHSR